VPGRVGFSKNTAPTALLLEQPRVAVGETVGRSEFHEKSISLFVQFVGDPKILQNLRTRSMPVQEAVGKKPAFLDRPEALCFNSLKANCVEYHPTKSAAICRATGGECESGKAMLCDPQHSVTLPGFNNCIWLLQSHAELFEGNDRFQLWLHPKAY
jgi:hypothetical protein